MPRNDTVSGCDAHQGRVEEGRASQARGRATMKQENRWEETKEGAAVWSGPSRLTIEPGSDFPIGVMRLNFNVGLRGDQTIPDLSYLRDLGVLCG